MEGKLLAKCNSDRTRGKDLSTLLLYMYRAVVLNFGHKINVRCD